jgi:hypothetical protein
MGKIIMLSKQKVHANSSEIFVAALPTYLLMILAEALKPGYVSNFFNIHIPLIIVIVTGITMVLSDADRNILRSAQRIFIYPADEISKLVSHAKTPESAIKPIVGTRTPSRSAPRVMDFSKRSINRLSNIKLRSRPPVQQAPPPRNTTIDIVKK